jgi:hypothetical protein
VCVCVCVCVCMYVCMYVHIYVSQRSIMLRNMRTDPKTTEHMMTKFPLVDNVLTLVALHFYKLL